MTGTKCPRVCGKKPAKYTTREFYNKHQEEPAVSHLSECKEHLTTRHLRHGMLSELEGHHPLEARSVNEAINIDPVSQEESKLWLHGMSLESMQERVEAAESFNNITDIPTFLKDERPAEIDSLGSTEWYQNWLEDPGMAKVLQAEAQMAQVVPHLLACGHWTKMNQKRMRETLSLPFQNEYIKHYDEKPFFKKNSSTSFNLADCTRNRETQGSTLHRALPKSYGLQHLIEGKLLQEHLLPVTDRDKIFCSTWLDDDHVIFGSKCKKLCLYNVRTNKRQEIPVLEGSRLANRMTRNGQGIHTVCQNPSKTLLLTQGVNNTSAAVYRLPDIEPLCIGEQGHRDIIFDASWVDDQFFASVSRDASLCLWKVEDSHWSCDRANQHNYQIIWPRGRCTPSPAPHRLRSVTYNPHRSQIATVSVNSFLLVWDSSNLQELHIGALRTSETVCIEVNEACTLYAVGSLSRVDFIETARYQTVCTIQLEAYCSVRSISFFGDVVTIGTSMGFLFFYDLKNHKFLSDDSEDSRLTCSKSLHNETILHNEPPAIYTHCYNSSGTKLFAAGGPLGTNVQGSYASIWG